MKDFIPLYRLSVYNSLLYQSENGLCWILLHFCSTGCKYLGKMWLFFQYLQSFPSKRAITKPLRSMFAVQQRREESFQVKHLLGSTRHPAPIFHCENASTYFSQWNVREAKGWETPLVTILNALCLEKWLTCSLLGSAEEEHKWHESSASVCCGVLFSSTFYSKCCSLGQPAPQHWLWFSTG